jgi:Ca-activated chloride channel family protein
MKNEDLKKSLNRLPVPEPDEAAKSRAVGSALAAFRRQAEEKNKGFSYAGRLMGKLTKGGPVMQKSIAVSGTLIAGCIALAIALSLTFLSQDKSLISSSRSHVGSVGESKLPVATPSETVRQEEFTPEEVTVEPARERAENPQKTAIAMGVVPDADVKGTGTGEKNELPVATPSETVRQEEFTLEEVTVTSQKRAENQQKVAVAMEVASDEDVRGIGKDNADDVLGSISNVTINRYPEGMRVASKPTAAVNIDGANNSDTASAQRLFDIERTETLVGPQITMYASNTPGAQPSSSEPSTGRPVDQAYVGQDKFDTIATNPVKLVAEEPVSTFSIDVDTASYAFVRRALNNGYLPQANAVRIEEMINYFDYDYPLPEDRSMPFKPTVAVFPTPWNADTKLLHIGIKGYDIVPAEKPKSNLVFLVDVSGSMRSEDKLPLLKNSLRMLVNTLEPGDTVGIVVYAGAAGTVLEPTPVAEKGKILTVLDRLQAGGSTAGGEGIELAYALAEANMDPTGVNRIILATDGDFNVGIQDPEVLKDFVARKRETGVCLSVLGFGQGNYNDTLMQKLAQNGNGNATYIDTLSEARKVLVDEASGSLFTIAGDVKLQVEFNPAMVAEYRLIGYETRLLNREDFKNDAVDAGDIGSGHSVTAIYEITPTAGNTHFIDPLRYQSDTEKTDGGSTSEYAFLKIRYKLPGETTSTEISKAIGKEDTYRALSKTPEESKFAAAVAAFGQLIRGDAYTQDYSYEDVIALAKGARGDDPYGYRSEFLNLVRLAETAGAMGER